MIIKSSGVLYLFDFDGTLFGTDFYKGYWNQLKNTFTMGPYINPGDFDVRWSILTGRPKMDKLILALRCWCSGLFPEVIHTFSGWFYPWKNKQEELQWKVIEIEKILKGEVSEFLKLRPLIFDRVVYIDNDIEVNSYINMMASSSSYRYISIGVKDFFDRKFHTLI